jgi:PPOX class probable F420-dependent enzyme
MLVFGLNTRTAHEGETMAERTISAAVRAFLESMKVPGVLSTIGRNGGPITSAVWFGFIEDDILISTPATRPKARNARANPMVSFLVDTKVRPYSGVAIEGAAEVLEDPDYELVMSIAHRYLGPELPPEMRERWVNTGRAALRIRPTRVRPWNLG